MKKNERVTIRIEDMSKNGEGIGRADGFALFVKDTVPGDLVEASVMKLKKNYGFARLIRVLEPSPDRVEAPCPVARQCGGCQLQMMNYETQLRLKESIVRNALEHIGGFHIEEGRIYHASERSDKLPECEDGWRMQEAQGREEMAVMHPIVPADPVFRHRNKAVVPVGTGKDGKPVAGFYAGHSHVIIPCGDCLLGPEENREILRIILNWMEEERIPAYDETSGSGLIRHIFLRKSRESGRFQLCLLVNGKKIPAVFALREALGQLRTSFGEPLICGACYSVNTKNTNVIFGGPLQTLWGDPVLEDSLHSEKYGVTVHYRISPMSFYQVNPNIAEKMYEEVLTLADLTGEETVFDLYCGTGTISLFLASQAAQVIGVEVVPDAVRNAKENAQLNNCGNVRFLEGKAEEVIPDLLEKEELRADVVVVDPPRKGCDASLLQTILTMRPEKIVYVSCDPATLARDLKILCADGYTLRSVRPYDQFAMGMHIETVCCLYHQKKEFISVPFEPRNAE